MKNTIKEKINNYITVSYKENEPVLLKDIYDKFTDIARPTIRSILMRNVKDNFLKKSLNGVYYIEKTNGILGYSTLSSDDIIDKKYIFDNNGDRVGYRSGWNFSNMLGLTSQTSCVTTVYSNAVSNNKRTLLINKHRLVINKPKVKVDNYNYKLLQVLDLMSKFEQRSEYSINRASVNINKYLKDVSLCGKDVDSIVDIYPSKAQVIFYKMKYLSVNASPRKPNVSICKRFATWVKSKVRGF